MQTEQATPYKALLLEQQASLQAQLSALRGGAIGRVQASAEHYARPEDPQAQLNTEKDLEFTLDAHESAELDAVQAALDRISAGRYGDCSDCGLAIPAARLRAAPTALRCIACQQRAEQHPPGGRP